MQRLEDVGLERVGEVDFALLQRLAEGVLVLVDLEHDLVDCRLAAVEVRVDLHPDELPDAALDHREGTRPDSGRLGGAFVREALDCLLIDRLPDVLGKDVDVELLHDR